MLDVDRVFALDGNSAVHYSTSPVSMSYSGRKCSYDRALKMG